MQCMSFLTIWRYYWNVIMWGVWEVCYTTYDVGFPIYILPCGGLIKILLCRRVWEFIYIILCVMCRGHIKILHYVLHERGGHLTRSSYRGCLQLMWVQVCTLMGCDLSSHIGCILYMMNLMWVICTSHLTWVFYMLGKSLGSHSGCWDGK